MAPTDHFSYSFLVTESIPPRKSERLKDGNLRAEIIDLVKLKDSHADQEFDFTKQDAKFSVEKRWNLHPLVR